MQPTKLNNEYFKVPQSELRISIQLAASAMDSGCVPKSTPVKIGKPPPPSQTLYFYLAINLNIQHILLQVLVSNLE
jgi:hypothetical protein